MKWFKYEIHDYMDLRPEIGFQLCENPAAAREWARNVQNNLSGTCRIIGYASKQELLDYIHKYHIKLDGKTMDNVNNDAYYE